MAKHRKTPCPHTLYRAIESENRQSAYHNKLVCICVTDFIDVLKPTNTDTEKLLKKYRLEDIQRDYALSENDLMLLLEAINH